MLDKYMREHYNEKMNRRSLMGDINLLYGKNMLGIINEIDEKFDKVYKNNREIVKNYLEKNEEEVKLREYLKKMKEKNRNSVQHKTKKDLIIGEEFPINYNNNEKISTKDLNKFSNEFKIRVHSRINTFSKIKMNKINLTT